MTEVINEKVSYNCLTVTILITYSCLFAFYSYAYYSTFVLLPANHTLQEGRHEDQFQKGKIGTYYI